jgi:hypothetical protein
MNKFELEGFITNNPCNINQCIDQHYSQTKQLVLEINRYAQSYQYELHPNKLNQVELLATGLYARTISTHQGVITLANNGMKHQSLMLLRCTLESVFQLKALANDHSFIELLKMQGLHHNRNGLERLLKMKNRNDQQDSLYERARTLRNKARKELRSHRGTMDTSELSIITTAKKAGMLDYYDALYAMGSSAIHSGIRSIEEHLVIDTDNLVKELINHPSHEDYEATVLAASDLIMNAILAIDQIFERKENEKATKLSSKLDSHLAQSTAE